MPSQRFETVYRHSQGVCLPRHPGIRSAEGRGLDAASCLRTAATELPTVSIARLAQRSNSTMKPEADERGRNLGTAELLCEWNRLCPRPEVCHGRNNLFGRPYRHRPVYSFFARSALGRSTL